MSANFQAKRTTLTFSARLFWPKFAQKWILRSKFWKSKSRCRISSSKIPCMPILRQNGELWLFRPKFAQKWILGSEFQKSKCRFKISTSKRPCMPIFSQNGQLWIFRPKFGEIAQLRAIFGSYNIKGVAESWVEAEMSWMEVDGAGWRWVHSLVIPIFLWKNTTDFFCCIILQFWVPFLMFVTTLARDHMEICFYINYAYHSSNPPLYKRGVTDFLKFDNKSGDEIFFLEREGLD